MMASILFAALAVTLEVETPEVTVGEPIVAIVTVANEGKERVTLPELVIDSRAVRFRVGEGGKQFLFQRKNDRAPGKIDVGPGERKSQRFEIPTVQAGTQKIEVDIAGVDKKAAGHVQVKPGADGATEAGVRLETGKGTIVLRMLPEAAPNTVAHFLERVRTGFYDGLRFHRVIKGFMAQGGDPKGNGSGGPGYTLPAEFSRDKRFAHTPGRLSMARTPDPDSAGSQFFLCFAGRDGQGPSFLDGQYTVFAETVEGMDTVRKIEEIGADKDPTPPKEYVKMVKATIVPIQR